MKDLSLVIPVYNEGDNIEALFDDIQDRVKGLDFEALVIYDFDGDNTLPAVERVRGKYPFKIKTVRNAYGRGALNAIKTGLLSFTSEAALVVMADLSDDFSIVGDMHKMIREGCDVVCGSRYMKGGKQIGGPLLKGLISRTAGVSLHLLSGIPTRDVTNSFKMYGRRALQGITIESDGGFEIGMEITVKAFVSGLKVAELPSVWNDRKAGESRFRLVRWLPKYLRWYFYALRGRR